MRIEWIPGLSSSLKALAAFESERERGKIVVVVVLSFAKSTIRTFLRIIKGYCFPSQKF